MNVEKNSTFTRLNSSDFRWKFAFLFRVWCSHLSVGRTAMPTIRAISHFLMISCRWYPRTQWYIFHPWFIPPRKYLLIHWKMANQTDEYCLRLWPILTSDFRGLRLRCRVWCSPKTFVKFTRFLPKPVRRNCWTLPHMMLKIWSKSLWEKFLVLCDRVLLIFDDESCFFNPCLML